MAEWEEKLSAILGDPEAMGQIVNIAKALSSASEPAGAPSPQEDGEGGEYVPVEGPQGGREAGPQPGEAPSSGGHPDAPESGVDGAAGLLSGLTGGEGGDPFSALGSLDPKLLSAALRLFQEYHAADDRKTALLLALKPFLKEERYAKVDQAVKIARLSRVIRVAFQLFRERNEGGERGV